jgi:hypothetical protein
MSDGVFDEIDDILPPEPNGELVHWMEPRPLTLGAAGISVAAASAFALGALAAVAVISLLHWGGPERAVPRLGRHIRRRT